MRKIYFIIVLLLSTSCSRDNKDEANSNNNVSDSIPFYYKRIDKQNATKEEKIKYLNKILGIIKKSQNSLKNREINYDLISKYYTLESWESYKNATEILLENSLSSNDIISQGNSYRSLGNYYFQSKQLDSSFYYYTKSEKIYKTVNNFDGYSTILLKKGIIQFTINDYVGADLSLTKALVAAKKGNDKIKNYAILNQLGLNSNQLQEYNKAIDYFNQALKILKESNFQNNEQSQESICLSNIGLVYQNLKNHRKAIEYFEKSLKFKNLKEDLPIAYSNIIDNIAYSKLQIGDFEKLPQFFFESLEMRKKINDDSAIVTSYIHLSEYYNKINNEEQALEYANKALYIAKLNKNSVDILFSLKQASVVDDKKASKYSDDYLRISDSLQVAERNSKDRFARIQLETDEIIQQKDILEDKNRSLLYTFIGVLFLLSLLFVVRAQRARTKELMFKQAQQRANEEIYNLLMAQQDIIDQSREIEKRKIARDLHDGILSRMFGARLNLDSINHLEDPESVKKRLEYLTELKEIEQDIREISHDLSREKQDLINNFVSITTNLFEEQSLTHPAKLTYFMDSSIKWDLVKNNIKINVFRILQESLQNINKYAKANNIHVEFRKENGELYITVTDDGIGFDIAKKSKGIGMQNMISRAIDCNGKLDISSNKENGTKITLTIPLE